MNTNKLTLKTIIKELRIIGLTLVILLLFAIISSTKLTKVTYAMEQPKHKIQEQVLYCEKVELQENNLYTLHLLNPQTKEGYIIGDYYAENNKTLLECYFNAIIDTLNNSILEDNIILELYSLDEYKANNANIDYNITKGNSIINQQVLTCIVITEQTNGLYCLKLQNMDTKEVYNFMDYKLTQDKKEIINKMYMCIINNNYTKTTEDDYIIQIYNIKEYKINGCF